MLKKSQQRIGPLTLASELLSFNINFYIVSDNAYFKFGVLQIINDIYEAYLRMYGVKKRTIISIKSYSSEETLNIYRDFDISPASKNCLKVIIADKDYLSVVALVLSSGSFKDTLFIPGNKCTKQCIKDIIERKDNYYHYRYMLPKFTLLGSVNTREKRICYYLYQGFSMKLIGSLMGIHAKTVSGYRIRVMRKIGCNTKGEFNKTLIKYFRLCRDK
ncbi:helix-turn-helix transcriptional regulator [Klebsiella aerogenes]|uniref:helix-turn-helix transcriptional regulator n=1 Tax=Klebsiella aerogenes TaxID=548 RepID=UPI001CC4C0C0|nr:LuxR C-terminal-related transcriptional regulator [Klebsiella aerogenes]UNX72896.1 LuxR family transcriptional regulator [Klebsiella aerogenes]